MVSSTEGATAVTVTASVTLATLSVASTVGVVPSAMVTSRSTVPKPERAKVTLYTPPGSPRKM